MDNQINIKYMFTVIGGGWERVSRAYFIADDRVYFLNKFSPDDLKMLENHFDDITATLASVNFDTTGLDFVNHGTKREEKSIRATGICQGADFGRSKGKDK